MTNPIHDSEITVIDSKSMQPIGHIDTKTMEHRLHPDTDLSAEELEERKREIHDISPEGTPAHPEFTSRGVMVMILGSFLAVIVVSAIVYAVWGFAPGALMLVFGLALALFGNPVTWASVMRATDLRRIEQSHHNNT